MAHIATPSSTESSATPTSSSHPRLPMPPILMLVRLYYNDYNIEGTSAKEQAAAAAIVKLVKDAGARIDGVGMQAHLTVGSVPSQSDLESAMQSYLSVDVTELAYTELDIRFSSLPASDDGLQHQIPSVLKGAGAALLRDENLVEKPAYSSVSSVLQAAGRE
ncbi:glycoside hydrolase superfamily [Hypoxylon sp. FL1150]|nr:glycoside hydrolase superfamily [Hypoxylon sp. FL1150]